MKIVIEYEYSFVSLSSSRRDEDLNSEFDKFELEMAPCYRNIASKPLELLGRSNIYMPIWRRKSETSYRLIYGEILRIDNNE